jgi:uncharacterized UPF0160 family protein
MLSKRPYQAPFDRLLSKHLQRAQLQKIEADAAIQQRVNVEGTRHVVEFAQAILEREIAAARGQVLARSVVRKAIAEATDPRLVILDRFAPWHEVVVPEAPEALFVLFPSETGDWRIQAIPPVLGSFEQRRSLPEAWAGKRGQELAELTGVADVIFVHPGKFIGGATSKAGVLEMARQALGE